MVGFESGLSRKEKPRRIVIHAKAGIQKGDGLLLRFNVTGMVKFRFGRGMRRPIGFLVALIGLFAFGLALADTVDTVWVRKYGMVGYRNWGRAITGDNAGNVYVAGEYGGDEYVAIKYRSNGDTAWVRKFDGGSFATAVKADAWGNVYVSGIKSNPPHGSRFNYYTLKYDSLGNQLWAAKDSSGGMFDLVYLRASLTLDDSGNVYLAGYTSLRTPTWDYLTVKRRPNGDTAWVRTYNGPLNGADMAQAIAVDDSGNVYVTGYSGGDSTVTQDYCTIKYLPNGDTAWVRSYDGPAHDCDQACDVAVDRARNVYVTGRSLGIGTSWDYCTIKFRPNGDTTWIRRYSGSSGSSDDEPCRLVVDRFGNVTVTGYSDLGSGFDWCTVSYDSSGTVKWIMRYNDGYWDMPKDITVDSLGNVYVTGSLGNVENFFTIKYDTAGITKWTARYDNSGNGWGYSEAISFDDMGCVYVTGVYGWLITTIKYVQTISGINTSWNDQGTRVQKLRISVSTPVRFELRANYFLPQSGEVSLKLYDVLGREVKEIMKGFQHAGSYRIEQNVGLPSGIYFLRLEGSGQAAMAKVIVVR